MNTAQMSRAGGDSPIGALLKQWRAMRRLSQLDLALTADTSARHLSFIETGRSGPVPGEHDAVEVVRAVTGEDVAAAGTEGRL